MKTRIVLTCVIALLLSACSKDVPAEDPAIATVAFTVNGQDYQWSFHTDSSTLEKGAVIHKTTSVNTGQPIYMLDIWNRAEKISILCAIHTQVLTVDTFTTVMPMTYPYLESFCIRNDTWYAASTGDYTSVQVSEISGKRISGCFGAVMHDRQSQEQELRIYRATFRNILVEP